MTKHTEDAPPPTDAPKPRPKLSELAKKMDAAIADADTKRAAVEAAKAQLDACTKDYGDAVAVVGELHTQYDALMKDVMSFGGTVHVAQ